MNPLPHHKKTAFWIFLAAAAVCVMVILFLSANPAQKPDPFPLGSDSQVTDRDPTEIDALGTQAQTALEPSDSETMIQYLDQWYNREDLSEDTIRWLEWYNRLLPEEQLAVSSVPWDLYELSGLRDGSDGPVTFETNQEIEETRPEEIAEDMAERMTEEALSFALNQAIRYAILQQKKGSYPHDYDIVGCDFAMLEMVTDSSPGNGAAYTLVCYGWALYMQYLVTEDGLEENGGCHVPAVLTFEVDQDQYTLKDYWEPRDGSYFISDIQDKFPEHLVQDAIDSQKFIIRQQQSCYRQAVEGTGLDTDKVIRRHLENLCSGPGASFDPQTIPGQNNSDYRELIKYGDYTLSYCSRLFDQGGETGLKGKIMALVCEELLSDRGELPLRALDAATGQLWYDTLRASGFSLIP